LPLPAGATAAILQLADPGAAETGPVTSSRARTAEPRPCAPFYFPGAASRTGVIWTLQTCQRPSRRT